MGQEIILNNQIPTEKIYSDRKVLVGASIGGPLVAGYLVAENFKGFGEFRKVRLTWIIAFAATISIFGAMMFAPYAERIPGQLFQLVFAGIPYFFVRVYQRGQMDLHVTNGGQFHSWWRVAGVSTIGGLITGVVIFAIAFTVFPSEKINTYGRTKNEIAYIEGNISEIEVDAIADALTKTGFFSDELRSFVYVEKSGGKYQISIAFDSSGSINSEVVNYYTYLRRDLQALFPDHKIVFKLVVEDIDNVIRRIE